MCLPPLLAIGLSHFPLIHPSSIRAAIPLKNSAPTPRQQRSRHGGDREAPAPTEAPQRATIPHALHNPVRESLSSPGSLDQHGPILPSPHTGLRTEYTFIPPKSCSLCRGAPRSGGAEAAGPPSYPRLPPGSWGGWWPGPGRGAGRHLPATAAPGPGPGPVPFSPRPGAPPGSPGPSPASPPCCTMAAWRLPTPPCWRAAAAARPQRQADEAGGC